MLLGTLALLGRQVASHLGSDLAFGAKGAIYGVHVDPPDDDRGWRAADRGPLLRQRPAGEDRVTGVDGARELPVQPLPFLHRRDRHVDRAQPDGYRDEQGGRSDPHVSGGGFDGKRGEIARNPRKQGDL